MLWGCSQLLVCLKTCKRLREKTTPNQYRLAYSLNVDIGNVKSVMEINFEVWSEIVWCKHLLIKNEAVLGHLMRGEPPIPLKF